MDIEFLLPIFLDSFEINILLFSVPDLLFDTILYQVFYLRLEIKNVFTPVTIIEIQVTVSLRKSPGLLSVFKPISVYDGTPVLYVYLRSSFGIVGFNGISTFVGYLKRNSSGTIQPIVGWIRGFNTFPKTICTKMNVIAWLDFELFYYNVPIQAC